MPKVDAAKYNAYQLWRSKRSEPDLAIARQTDLRKFREKFGVEKGSNFHCPWCYTGRLYEIPDEPNIYVCRQCELKWKLESLSTEGLQDAINLRKKEREKKKLQERDLDKKCTAGLKKMFLDKDCTDCKYAPHNVETTGETPCTVSPLTIGLPTTIPDMEPEEEENNGS